MTVFRSTVEFRLPGFPLSEPGPVRIEPSIIRTKARNFEILSPITPLTGLHAVLTQFQATCEDVIFLI